MALSHYCSVKFYFSSRPASSTLQKSFLFCLLMNPALPPKRTWKRSICQSHWEDQCECEGTCHHQNIKRWENVYLFNMFNICLYQKIQYSPQPNHVVLVTKPRRETTAPVPQRSPMARKNERRNMRSLNQLVISVWTCPHKNTNHGFNTVWSPGFKSPWYCRLCCFCL